MIGKQSVDAILEDRVEAVAPDDNVVDIDSWGSGATAEEDRRAMLALKELAQPRGL